MQAKDVNIRGYLSHDEVKPYGKLKDFTDISKVFNQLSLSDHSR